MKMNKRKDKLLWLFLLPSVVGICLFYVFPYQKLVHYSLIKGLTDKNFSGIENYQSVLKNTAFCIAVRNTAEIMALGVVIMVPFSLYLATKINSMRKKNCLMWMLSPIVVPAACTAMVWRILFGSSGALNQLLLLIGVRKVSWMDGIYGKNCDCDFVYMEIYRISYRNFSWSICISSKGIRRNSEVGRRIGKDNFLENKN